MAGASLSGGTLYQQRAAQALLDAVKVSDSDLALLGALAFLLLLIDPLPPAQMSETWERSAAAAAEAEAAVSGSRAAAAALLAVLAIAAPSGGYGNLKLQIEQGSRALDAVKSLLELS